MATLETFLCFESGTIRECGVNTTVSIVSTPTPPDSDETYVAEFNAGGADDLYIPAFASGNDKYVVGFYLRITEVNPSPNWHFFTWESDTKLVDFVLHLVDGGAICIHDANGAVVATSDAGVLTANTWHLVEFLFERGDPGSLVVWVDEGRVLATSGEDYDGGGGANPHSPYLAGQGVGAGPCDMYVSSLYVLSGAGSVVDLLGPFGCLAYQNRRNSGVPDSGDNLDVGTWADAAEIPFNDVNYGKYTGSSRIGIVTTHITDGGAIPGPYGDARLGAGDIIIGASWLFRYLCSFLSSGWCHYGDIPYGTPTVDGTASVGMTATGSILNKFIVSGAAADVPSENEYFQYGIRAQAMGASDVRLYDCVCSLLVKRVVVFRGVHLGAGPVGRSQGKEILIG